MVRTMYETLLDQSRIGKRADSGWKSEAWVKVLARVTTVTPATHMGLCTLKKLKDKEANYKQQYKDWKWLLAQSGFRIHLETRCVTVSDKA